MPVAKFTSMEVSLQASITPSSIQYVRVHMPSHKHLNHSDTKIMTNDFLIHLWLSFDSNYIELFVSPALYSLVIFYHVVPKELEPYKSLPNILSKELYYFVFGKDLYLTYCSLLPLSTPTICGSMWNTFKKIFKMFLYVQRW